MAALLRPCIIFRHEDAPRGTFCATTREARGTRWGVLCWCADLVAATSATATIRAAARVIAAASVGAAAVVARAAAVVVVAGAVLVGRGVDWVAGRVVIVTRTVLLAPIVDEAGVAGDDTSQQRCVHRAAVIGSCRGCERVAASGEEAEESTLFLGLGHWVPPLFVGE